jgi:hypothetical protein
MREFITELMPLAIFGLIILQIIICINIYKDTD